MGGMDAGGSGKEKIMNDNIKMLPVARLHPHPDNPRKNLGDISELAASIKARGIMQNLTVVPDNGGGYTVLIGHRRLAAAKEAGLTAVPCAVMEQVSYGEQISIMLLENIQRNDLTVQEQGQGFQMMLDLGETAETIAEKTGFSKTTVYHRLNIAKLDQELLAEKQDCFQLTLTDMAALEQIKDVRERNAVLERSATRDNLAWNIKAKVNEEQRKEKADMLVQAVRELGAKLYEGTFFPYHFDIIDQYDLDKDIPKKMELQLKTGPQLEEGRQAYYYPEPWRFYLFYEKEQKETEGPKDNKEARAKEAKAKEAESLERYRKIKDIFDGQNRLRKEFLTSLRGKTQAELPIDDIWDKFVKVTAMEDSLLEMLSGKDIYEMDGAEAEKAREALRDIPASIQMLMLWLYEIDGDSICTYDSRYDAETGEHFQTLDRHLEKLGFSLRNDEDYNILLGTSELYKKD